MINCTHVLCPDCHGGSLGTVAVVEQDEVDVGRVVRMYHLREGRRKRSREKRASGGGRRGLGLT